MKMKKKCSQLALLVLLFAFMAGSSCAGISRSPLEKEKTNPFLSLWVGLFKDANRAYDHSIIRTFRGKSDCQPDCPKVDVWQYQYKDPVNEEILESTLPISTKKKYWKVSFEARIISVSLFGSNPKYLEGLKDYIKSNQMLKKVNDIPQEQLWGYDTFTFRVYVPKRNPENTKRKPISSELPENFIKTLLDLGCEIAFVDNGLDVAGLDATFWRFMVAAEEMMPGEKIRYLIRDADWLSVGAEAFAVGEWINSGLRYHRAQLMPACIGPMSPMGNTNGGWHFGPEPSWTAEDYTKKHPLWDLKDYMDKYPYHLYYGDDEMFARDIMWPKILNVGSMLTHYYEPSFYSFISEPYENSCARPTQNYCNAIRKNGICEDRAMPSEIPHSFIVLGNMDDNAHALEKPFLFDLHLNEGERFENAAKGLSVNPLNGSAP